MYREREIEIVQYILYICKHRCPLQCHCLRSIWNTGAGRPRPYMVALRVVVSAGDRGNAKCKNAFNTC